MNFKNIRKEIRILTIDQDYISNILYLNEKGIQKEFQDYLIKINLQRTLIISGAAFLLSLYITIMDFSFVLSFDTIEVNPIYKIIDPFYTVFTLFIFLTTKYAKKSARLHFRKIIILLFVSGSVINYSLVSSIEQFDFNHHPSFVLCMIIFSVLFYFKPKISFIFFILGFIIILTFYRIIEYSVSDSTIYYSLTLLTLPICFIISKINYNNILEIYVDKDELERVNSKLEKQVLEKTHELKDANEELISQLDLQKQYEISLTQAKDRAERSDRLKTAFLGNLSHEIRTPLNSIIGFSSLLNNPRLGQEKTKRYTSLINNCGKELVYIIDQLVEISRIQSGEIEIYKIYFLLNSFLDEIKEKSLDRIRESKKENIHFFIDNNLYDNNLRLYNDQYKIETIILNLIENAIKYTLEGRIEISCSLGNDQTIIFSVKDTGIGISKKDKEILFELFTQAESGISRKYGGLGLGLSISKTYAELIGGKIWFESTEGKGSVFYFSLSI